MSSQFAQWRHSQRLLALAAAAALTPEWALAGANAVRTYIGPNGGNWSTPANWNPNGSPQLNDIANVSLAPTAAFSVNFDQNYTTLTQLDGVSLSSSTTFSLTLNQTLAGDNLFANFVDVGNGGQATYNQTAATASGNGLALGLAAGGAVGSGTYLLSGAGTVSFTSEGVGTGGPGLFNQNGGSNTAGSLAVGQLLAGGSGTYSLSGSGSLHVSGNDNVGYGANGSFVQAGGTHTADSDLSIAYTSGVTGSYALSGGLLNVSGNLYVGGSGVGSGGAGSFILTNGIATVANTLKVFNTTGSQLSFAGGVLHVKTLDLSGHPALLNWTGGELNFTAGYTVDANFPLGATFTVPAGTTLLGSLASTNNGTMNISGASLQGSGTFTNNGTISGPGFLLTAMNNAGTITSTTAGTFNITGSLTNTSQFNVSGASSLFVVSNVVNSGNATFAPTEEWSGASTFTNTAGTATFQGDPAGSSGSYNLVVSDSGGVVAFDSSARLFRLRISSGVTAVIDPVALPFSPRVLDTVGLTFSGTTSKLDVGNNELLVTTTIAAIQTDLTGGQIFSSQAPDVNKALGYADTHTGKVEVRYTLKGDANLDGVVNVGDLGALATNYGLTAVAVWSQGDFNNDTNVNVADLGALATNYGTALAGGPAAGEAIAADAIAAVPEPSMLALLGLLSSSIAVRSSRRARSARARPSANC